MDHCQDSSRYEESLSDEYDFEPFWKHFKLRIEVWVGLHGNHNITAALCTRTLQCMYASVCLWRTILWKIGVNLINLSSRCKAAMKSSSHTMKTSTPVWQGCETTKSISCVIPTAGRSEDATGFKFTHSTQKQTRFNFHIHIVASTSNINVAITQFDNI